MTKRTGQKQQLKKKSDTRVQTGMDALFRFGDFQFDSAARELWRNGRKQQLSSKCATLLYLLLESAPRPVSRDGLAEALWGNRKYADFDDRLNHVVSRLRRSLSDSADHPHYIQTAHGLGYRMMAPVSTVRTEEPERWTRTIAVRAQEKAATWFAAALGRGHRNRGDDSVSHR